MAKGKSRKGKELLDGISLAAAGKRCDDSLDASPAPPTIKTRTTTTTDSRVSSSSCSGIYIVHWILHVQEHPGILWVVGCCLLGAVLGFGIGSGLFTGEFGNEPNAWRITLGIRIRETMVTLQQNKQEPIVEGNGEKEDPLLIMAPMRAGSAFDSTKVLLRGNDDPSHPIVYAVLREAVVREKGGFVHPDLGIMEPAPSGAARGIGIVRDSWHQCQIQCFPGIASEKLAFKQNKTEGNSLFNNNNNNKIKNFQQEEIMIKVPLSFQMTRTVALETLLPLISAEVQRKASIHELDDAALLVLLLAHERGGGKYSRWLPYIASLPLHPSCGYSRELRIYFLDSILALKEEVGLDVSGWSGELLKATQYAAKIASSLARDYGSFLQHPMGMDAVENIEWALCQVASRAIAGSQEHGSLRMVPLADMINHDASAGGFVELMGEEKLDIIDNDFLDATEDDSGALVVRSLRHGRRKALKVGQELLVNYNVPHYSPLDWFISLGFVPPERWREWEKIDAALPRVRRDGPFGAPEAGTRNAV